MSTAILMVLRMIFGYRGSSAPRPARCLKAVRDTGRAASRHYPHRSRRRHSGGLTEHFRHLVRADAAIAHATAGNIYLLLFLIAVLSLHPRHGPADGERLRSNRDAVGADIIAWRDADGGICS